MKSAKAGRQGRRSFPLDRGFTIIEMMVALILSSIILVGLMDISAGMLRHHFNGIRHGRVDFMTLYALEQMRMELESATYIGYPLPGATPANYIGGCGNYTTSVNGGGGGAINSAQPITSFAYCVQNCSSPSGPCDLIRYSASGACSPSCSGTAQTLVYQNVYLEPAYPLPFSWDEGLQGADMHLIIGNPKATAMQVQSGASQESIFYQIDTNYVPEVGRVQ